MNGCPFLVFDYLGDADCMDDRENTCDHCEYGPKSPTQKIKEVAYEHEETK